jgi:hypothetical protein
MYRQLARWRLRWYLHTSGNIVLRHWQWFVLACLVVPGTPVVSLLLHTASLLELSVSPGLDIAQRLLVAIAIELLAVLWILPQRHALSGGTFMRYVAALPLPFGVSFCIEATLLIVANSLILLSVGIVAGRQLMTPVGSYTLCCFITLLGLATLAQHAILIRRRIILLGVVMGDCALAAGMTTHASRAKWLLLIAAIGSAVGSVLARRFFERSGATRRLGLGMRIIRVALSAIGGRVPALVISAKR